MDVIHYTNKSGKEALSTDKVIVGNGKRIRNPKHQHFIECGYKVATEHPKVDDEAEVEVSDT